MITNPSLWFTRRDVAESRGAELGAFAGALEAAGLWAAASPGAAAELFAESEGGRPEDWEAFVRRIPWTVHAVGSRVRGGAAARAPTSWRASASCRAR